MDKFKDLNEQYKYTIKKINKYERKADRALNASSVTYKMSGYGSGLEDEWFPSLLIAGWGLGLGLYALNDPDLVSGMAKIAAYVSTGIGSLAAGRFVELLATPFISDLAYKVQEKYSHKANELRGQLKQMQEEQVTMKL